MKTSKRSTVRISMRISVRDRAELRWRAQAAKLTVSEYLLIMGLQLRRLPDPRRPRSPAARFPTESSTPRATEIRSTSLQLRVVPADRDRLRQAAKSARYPLSSYLIARGCRRPVSAPLNADLLAARRQVARIGSNLSQLYHLFQDAPGPLSQLGALTGMIKQFDARLASPDQHLDLCALISRLKHFGQALNTVVVQIRLGLIDRLPDEIGYGALSLRQDYLIDGEGKAS